MSLVGTTIAKREEPKGMRTERIVIRQGLKEQLANLKKQIQLSRPLLEADARLKQVYQAGFQAGYKKRLEEEVAEAAATPVAFAPLDPFAQPPAESVLQPSTDEGKDAKDSRSTQEDQ